MEITNEIIRKSVAGKPFGSIEPFVTGDEGAIAKLHDRVLAGLARSRLILVFRELDHHGSGYASYVSAFLYPRDVSTQKDHPAYVETTGILLYMSRLAPIAVYGSSSRTKNKDNSGESSGFIEIHNLNNLPEGNWSVFIREVKITLARHGIELLPREPLLLRAPEDVDIPTVFDGPYHVFDTLFYWCD